MLMEPLEPQVLLDHLVCLVKLVYQAHLVTQVLSALLVPLVVLVSLEVEAHLVYLVARELQVPWVQLAQQVHLERRESLEHLD